MGCSKSKLIPAKKAYSESRDAALRQIMKWIAKDSQSGATHTLWIPISISPKAFADVKNELEQNGYVVQERDVTKTAKDNSIIQQHQIKVFWGGEYQYLDEFTKEPPV